MDDKKFEEIMHKYVSGKSKGKNADFRKLYSIEKTEKTKKSYCKLIWASVSCMLIVALALAIALPLTLQSSKKDSESQPPKVYYCEIKDIEMIVVDSYNDYSTYNISAMMPDIVCQDIGTMVMKSKIDNHVIGAYIALSIYDEYFDNITINIIAENNVLNYLEIYEKFSQEVLWQSETVQYYIEYNDLYGSYETKIFFMKDSYKYYLDLIYYENLDITDILDMVFN